MDTPKPDPITTPSTVHVASATKDTILELTFLKLAVHAQNANSDLLFCTNNGVWCLLAGGPSKIIEVTRCLTPVVEKWKYNELQNRNFNYTDTIAEAVHWMAEVGNECFHVVMELPCEHKELSGDRGESELQVMYAMGIRGEGQVRAALQAARLI